MLGERADAAGQTWVTYPCLIESGFLKKLGELKDQVGSGGRCGRKVETWEVDGDGVGWGECLGLFGSDNSYRRPPVTSRLGIVQLLLTVSHFSCRRVLV